MSGKAASDWSKLDSPITTGRRTAFVALAEELFVSLAPLHGLSTDDRELLALAVELRDCRHGHLVAGATSAVLLQATMATLPAHDVLVIEAVEDLSKHSLGYDSGIVWSLVPDADRTRILWLTALVRFAEAADARFGSDIEGFYAAWTDTMLHVELDGSRITESGLRAVRARCAALEVASSRQVVLTSSHRRRCGGA